MWRALVIVIAFAACAPTQDSDDGDDVELTYYYLQYCRVCDATRRQLAPIPDELHGAASVRMVHNLEPEAKEMVKRQGWNSHGLVIRKGRRVVYSASDHRANAYDAHVALRELFGLPLDCR